MDLYDDLNDWGWDRDELSGGDADESIDSSEDSSSSSGDLSVGSHVP